MRPVLVFLFSWILWVPISHADYTAGITAYQQGDYETALEEFRALADRRVVLAYTSLGHMYALGEGVEPDIAEAASWFRKAAEAGSVASQMTLGVLYFNGEGVDRDYLHAYAWLNVAAAGGRDDALDYLNLVAARMSPDDIGKARRLARRLFDAYGDADLRSMFSDIDEGARTPGAPEPRP